jgi:alkanesulfonate monooxygenase SsuD/methylene tetrahydromethanopterin reductase-like flavin-dependent oxidoreductase (luciferase family)
MLPLPHHCGGPPIWCGGRANAALRRAAELADGYLSYSDDDRIEQIEQFAANVIPLVRDLTQT